MPSRAEAEAAAKLLAADCSKQMSPATRKAIETLAGYFAVPCQAEPSPEPSPEPSFLARLAQAENTLRKLAQAASYSARLHFVLGAWAIELIPETGFGYSPKWSKTLCPEKTYLQGLEAAIAHCRGLGLGSPSPVPEPFPIPLANCIPSRPMFAYDRPVIQDLADSMQAQGQLQPIEAIKLPGDRWRIANGCRRLQAAILLGLPTLQAFDRTARRDELKSRVDSGGVLTDSENDELLRLFR